MDMFKTIILTGCVLKRKRYIPVAFLPPTSTMRIRALCQFCKRERYVMFSSVRRAGHTACIHCTNARKNAKPLHSGLRSNKLTVIKDRGSSDVLCECDCGNECTVSRYAVSSGRQLSCGCSRKGNKPPRVFRGEQHWNWRGGISGQRERDMVSKEYREWRLAVYERDAYTCVKCDQVGGELNCHHILPYSLYPDHRTSVDNGATLCIACHRLFHKEYGNINIGYSQFNKFLYTH